MTEEIKEETKELPPKKLFAEGRGRYTLVDNTKVFNFEFSLQSTLEENFAAISYIKEEILKTIQLKEKEAKEKEDEKPLSEKIKEIAKETGKDKK